MYTHFITAERMPRRAINALWLIWILISALALPQFAWAEQKPMIAFSIDQALPNGPVRNRDNAGLTNVVNSLKLFRNKFDVYVVIAGNYKNQEDLNNVLELLASNDNDFIIDVYSSDVFMVPYGNASFDASHGIALSIDSLQALRDRFGSHFAGVRVMEVFGENSVVVASKNGHPPSQQWADRTKGRVPDDDFYQRSILESFFAFAQRNKMFLMFADHYYSGEGNPVIAPEQLHQAQNEQDVKELSDKYPGVAIVTYDNNASFAPRFETHWEDLIKPLMSKNALGHGLSDQAWICKGAMAELHCPVPILVKWAVDAYSRGARIVQFEPNYYFWAFPRMDLTKNNYASLNPAIRGCPKYPLKALATALGVTIPDAMAWPCASPSGAK